jgi:serine/threonine protein phosphatase PrpC
MVADENLFEIVDKTNDLEGAVAELVDQANRNGGTDNITTLLLQCSLTPAEKSARTASGEDKTQKMRERPDLEEAQTMQHGAPTIQDQATIKEPTKDDTSN